MIFKEFTVTVKGNESTINEPIYLYKHDQNVELRFNVGSAGYKYTKSDNDNIIIQTNASYCQVRFINTLTQTKYTFDVTPTADGQAVLLIKGELIDEETELGTYDFQIRLLDDSRNSIASLPPVKGAIHIEKPLFEDVVDTPTVNSAIVNIARLNSNGDATDTYNPDGTYNKTNWGTGDIITASKLNKLEAVSKDNVDKIKALPNQTVDLTPYAKKAEIPTKTSQLTNDSSYITQSEVDLSELDPLTNNIVVDETLDYSDLAIGGENGTGDANKVKITDAGSYYTGDTVEGALQEVGLQIKSVANDRATKEEVAVERQRINSLATLSEGSTTGDAELIDARVGTDGVIYDNVGNANREQFKLLNEKIFTTEYLTGLTWVLKHINGDGTISANNNKNVVTQDMHLLKKGTKIYVDSGYKFQLALYDKTSKSFIERITWMTTTYVLSDDYNARVEISDSSETVQSDTSISSHIKISTEKDKIQKNIDDIQKINKLINILGVDLFKRKVINVAEEYKYTAWPFISVVNDKFICLYTRVNSHEDYNSGVICAKTSDDGVLWEKEKIILSNGTTRTSVTGKGKSTNGKVMLFWVRTNETPTKYELYGITHDGIVSKIAAPTFDFGYGHIGDIIFVPNLGLMSFYNTYDTNRSWGIVVSADGGSTWTSTKIETCTANSECPVEISGAYIDNGKILAIGRKDIDGNTRAQFQIQSSDYGKNWTKQYTNITDIALSTPSIIYNESTKEISNYYFQRGKALRVRKDNVDNVWDNPTNWPESEIIAKGYGNMEDEGNVNATEYKGNHFITYYNGNSTRTGIYEVII